MTDNTTPSAQPVSDGEADTDFIKKFRELKKQRNNHLIDEPDFDEAVEQLAANTYAHGTADEWCCACEADVAFMKGRISQSYQSGYAAAVGDAVALAEQSKKERPASGPNRNGNSEGVRKAFNRGVDHYRTAIEALTPTEQISKGE